MSSHEDLSARRVALVVEDDADTQTFMRAVLAPRFEVVAATSAAEARAVLGDRGREVAVVLMDLSLKGEEDGLSLTRAMKVDPEWSEIPVVAVTAHAFREDRSAALEAGCAAFVEKPFARGKLLSLIDDLVGRSDRDDRHAPVK